MHTVDLSIVILYHLFFVGCPVYCEVSGSTLDIKTSHGWVQGNLLTTSSGYKGWSFQGIPYAQPPTGALRFKKPLPALAWNVSEV